MNAIAPQPAERMAPPALSAMPAGAWKGEVFVRFSHCDPAGIVYFARYIDMLNGVIEDWFSGALGLSYHQFIGPRRTGLGFVRADAEFMRPASMGEVLTFVPLIDRIGGSSLALTVHAWRDAEPVLTAKLVIVATSLDRHRPTPIPDDLRAALERYREACA